MPSPPRRVTSPLTQALGLLGVGLLLAGCPAEKNTTSSKGVVEAAGTVPTTPPAAEDHVQALSQLVVPHGDLDLPAPPDAPLLASTVIAATIYAVPNSEGRRIGYVRLGQRVPRDPGPSVGRGCKGEWYRVYPLGFMCTEEATTDLEAPLVRAAAVGPDLSRPLPYKYGFVRATAPQYLRIPTKKAQLEAEFGLEEHLAWYAEHKAEVQTAVLGANDVPLDRRGVATPGLQRSPGVRTSTELSLGELFGAKDPAEPAPFWLTGSERSIPNVAEFKVPEYAWFADRVSRHTGLSFVGSFEAESEGLVRRFGVTVDLRLIPTSKVKPDTGSDFHGIEIKAGMHLPFAWVLKREVTLFKLIKGQDKIVPAEPAPRRALVLLSGAARIKAGQRYYQTLADGTRWLAATDIGIVHQPDVWPRAAEQGKKWIDISLGQQTLVLYEGKTPRYATLVSTGRDRFGDPEKDLATPTGDFTLQSKHIAAAMDSNENSSVAGGQKTRAVGLDDEARATIERLKKAVSAGQKLSEEDARRQKNIEKGRHPEYGVTQRRGGGSFELRDVPWIQYFSKGFALHGAYWHDVFGIPRSHGCINLAPIDARIVFNWTDPPVPAGWHGLNIGSDMGEPTLVHIRR
jgi:hypothetical protein